MPSKVNVRGLVLRETEYGEHDKLLTVLTGERGRITVIGKGVKSLKSPSHAVSQLFAYAEFTLHEKNDRFWIVESSLIENFFSLRQELTRYALALYLSELAETVSVENEPSDALLSLLLNALYALSRGEKSPLLIKAALETRILSDAGFCPMLDGCVSCGALFENGSLLLDPQSGALFCPSCVPDERKGQMLPVSESVLAALRYLVSCPGRRLFAFSLASEELASLSSLSEAYAAYHLEREFRSLSFYHRVREMEP